MRINMLANIVSKNTAVEINQSVELKSDQSVTEQFRSELEKFRLVRMKAQKVKMKLVS